MHGSLKQLLLVVACLASTARAHAFSDPLTYTDPVDLGGGAGRWFTGSPADGYGCDVCHTGSAGAELTVDGLPQDGFIPGQAYEVLLTWPPQVLDVALIAEFTDDLQHGAGRLSLPRPDALQPGESCAEDQGGESPAQLHDTEQGRQLLSLVDCGARFLRFQWTAPLPAASNLWFNAGFVASDQDTTPSGDGVTLVRLPLPAAGGTFESAGAQGCSATPRAGSPLLVLLLLLVVAARFRARQSGESM